MASYYMRYLDLMSHAARILRIKPAEVEMALFMLGDMTCTDPATWRRTRGELKSV